MSKIKKFFFNVQENGLEYIFLSISFKLNKLFYRLTKKIYVSEPSIRSWSDDGSYLKVVKKFLTNENSFRNFKRSHYYREVLEHADYRDGLEYIRIINKENSDFIKNIDTYKINDFIGNPITFNYKDVGIFSPTTLRYLRVASDIKKHFGDIQGNIAEIGCGYGGQFLILDRAFSFNSYTMFDLLDVNKLIEKYLEHHLTNSYYRTSTINQFDNQTAFDFIISNYAFSELPKKLQIKYMERFIKFSKAGYLTMNSGKERRENENCLSIDDIKYYLPSLKIIEEEPKTYETNYVIIWGEK